jgi:hypothetical protein
MVNTRRSDDWLKEWILDPESKMHDKDIEAMRQQYKLAMPNQNVSKDDVGKVIEYLKAKSEAVMKEMQNKK